MGPPPRRANQRMGPPQRFQLAGSGKNHADFFLETPSHLRNVSRIALMTEHVITTDAGDIRTIRINRPDKKNALALPCTRR